MQGNATAQDTAAPGGSTTQPNPLPGSGAGSGAGNGQGNGAAAGIVGAPAGCGFPASLTRLVGRETEIEQLVQLLRDHRMVTITGPGGIGKTRAAAEATARIGDQLAHVWLVELAGLPAGDDIVDTVAAALGPGNCRAGQTPPQAIATTLASEPSLLVLDNCEHVVGAVADLCDTLLGLDDDVRILTTSREPIGVPGEARLRLGALPAHAVDATGAAAGVLLFADRARLVAPDFDLTPQNADMVAEIVERLGGLPLAIELAAARHESLSLAGLRQRMERPLAVLTSGPRSAPERQRSLRATVDWSYRLLAEPQRQVLRRLAVLPGPFTLDTATAIAGDEAAEVVPELVDRSLITPPRTPTDGQPRYAMLPMVRDFAREELAAAGAESEAMRALADYAVFSAELAASQLATPGLELAGVRRFDLDHAVLHRASHWAREHDPHLELRLQLAQAAWWKLRGWDHAGYARLSSSLSRASEHDELRLEAQLWLGRHAAAEAEWQLSVEHFTRVLDEVGSGSASPLRMEALMHRSGPLRNQLRLAEAVGDAREALRLARELGRADGEARALTALSLAANYARDSAEAMRRAQQAAEIDPESLTGKMRRRVLLTLAFAQADAGLIEQAEATCSAGLEAARLVGDLEDTADFLCVAADIALRAGDAERACVALAESLPLAARSGDRLRIADDFEVIARACSARGRHADALTVWAARAANLGTLHAPDLPLNAEHFAQLRVTAHARLAPAEVEEAEDRGSRMSVDAAVQFALLALAERPQPEPRPHGVLTARERELLALVAGGRTDAQIAQDLFISIRTVRSHLDRIREKTGSRRRADLTRLAIEVGLV